MADRVLRIIEILSGNIARAKSLTLSAEVDLLEDEKMSGCFSPKLPFVFETKGVYL